MWVNPEIRKINRIHCHKRIVRPIIGPDPLFHRLNQLEAGPLFPHIMFNLREPVRTGLMQQV